MYVLVVHRDIVYVHSTSFVFMTAPNAGIAANESTTSSQRKRPNFWTTLSYWVVVLNANATYLDFTVFDAPPAMVTYIPFAEF